MFEKGSLRKLIFGYIAHFFRQTLLWGVLFGIIIWIIGPLIAMPMMMGMGTKLSQAFASQQLMSLMTHIFFSLILAVVYKVMKKGNTTNENVSA